MHCHLPALNIPVVFFLNPLYSVKAQNADLIPAPLPLHPHFSPFSSLSSLYSRHTDLRCFRARDLVCPSGHPGAAPESGLRSLSAAGKHPLPTVIGVVATPPTPVSPAQLPFSLRPLAIRHLLTFADRLPHFIYCSTYSAWHPVGAQGIFMQQIRKIARKILLIKTFNLY